MHPVICTIGPVSIFSYGLMLAIAVLVGSSLASREAAGMNLPRGAVTDTVFWMVLGGLVGGRLFYVLLNFSFYAQAPMEIFMLHHGGLAWQGGFVGGTLAAMAFVRRQKLSLGVVVDLFAPYLALGQAIGRVGCFLNGCCYGKPVAWGVFHPALGARVHPAPLYLSAGYLVIFFLLKRYKKDPARSGAVFCGYVLWAAGLRFFVEFVRGDHAILWGGLTLYQYICLGFILAAFYGHTRLKS